MSDIANKVVLITGASSGIGEATARHLAGRGAHVVLGARRADRLETIAAEIRCAGGSAIYRPLDVTDPADMTAFVDFAIEAHGHIDVLVNNAGLMPLSPLAALKVDEWNRMIDVNIKGVLSGIAATLPRMKAQGHGHFVNVSSVAGHRVMPTSAVYSATKFAVMALSEGLRVENDDIRVTVISPGATESELAHTITDADTAAMIDRYRQIAIPADAIARAIGFAIEQPGNVDVNEIIVRPTAQP
ncbi:NADP-dependent 3-hydroxy acid dehydrogenase YdfG [Sphingomonas laterariae]|uniref:NADP-dependent 3-hydroxy acid dehydrogenase YdfG n=1 Tax=Edaphosphingomonas laterariae TaxID=861865 RepID=A0A239GPI5_9SPHN|nr:SDR family oxidoreductase [Sphingomonas laterariae]SNS70004.1 NADP-dependent 3-hydroxy acid dehydrogenase YdfG [Sphingomonas laterariae]